MTLRTPTLVLILLLSALLGCNNTPSRPITLVTSPEVVTLEAGSESVEVSAMIQNGDGPISWQLSPQVGSLSQSNGPVVRYTPPATLATETIVTLTASIPNGPSATITLTLRPGLTEAPQLTVRSSLGATTYGGRTVRLEATPQATASDTRWSLSPPLGSLSNTIGATVEYTPPPFVGEPTEVTINAHNEVNSTLAASKIILRPPTLSCNSYWNARNNNTIVGYTPKPSYTQGETVELKVSSPRGRFAVAIYHETTNPRMVYFRHQVEGGVQSLPTDPFANDLQWPTSLSFTIPEDWPSGLYNALLIDETRQCFETIFAVRPQAVRPKAPIALLASDFTWQAYNSWGGASTYDCPGRSLSCYQYTPRALISHTVTTQRPNSRAYIRAFPNVDQQFASGLHLVTTWLEQNSYPFDLITDTDLDSEPQILSGYRVLILERHSEYWTSRMYDALESYLDGGGNLVNLGANQIYWKTVAVNGHLEVRKDGSTHTLDGGPGGLWRNLGRPEARILGVRFTSIGMGYSNRSSYTVLEPAHWIFEGTRLQAGQTFGEGCSGWETDKIDPQNRPAGLTLLARGNNTDSNPALIGQAGADMVYYNHPGGGGVFSSGSLAFWSLTCRNDIQVSQIFKNVLDRFLR